MAFAIIAALNELNVAPVVVNTLYIGLVAALALALGLAFGLGGRDTAARLTEQWADQLETTTKKVQASQPPSSAIGSVRSASVPESPPIGTTRAT
jgi:hypothetical protein